MPSSAARESSPEGYLDALTELSHDLARAFRPATVVRLVGQALQQLLAPDSVTIAIIDVETRDVELVHHEGNGPAAGDDPLVQLAVREGPLAFAGAVDEAASRYGVRLPAPAPSSWIGIPIVAVGRTIGAISIRGAPPSAYGDVHRALVSSIAAQCAIALENARLFELLSTGKREWEQTVDAISQAICIIDGEGTIVRGNRVFAAMVHVPVTALTGQQWLPLVPPEWADPVTELLTTSSPETPLELRTADRIYAVAAHVIEDADLTVLVFEDQTDKRRLQEQLIQSEKLSAIGQLLAGVAHDLNNPLASVVGFADYLNESTTIPSELAEPLAVIQKEAERAAGIVKNLLMFARKHEGERRHTSVQTLLTNTLGLVRNQLRVQRVEIRVDIDDDLPPVMVDANQIQQVFMNLINNAAQAITATQSAGTISVSARRWLDGVAISIADDGPGIPQDVKDRVFEPFFTTKPAETGTGLGLSIAQGIVKEHGGRITVDSRPDRGATFTTELPAAQGQSRDTGEHVATGEARELKVLVVDDEPHILHYMRATLEAWGHEVVVASDGAEAIGIAQRESFDLVLCDLRMPRLGGREFYAALEQLDPSLANRVIFATGDTVRGDTLAFLEHLERPYLSKPFKLAELRKVLSRFMAPPDGD